ncbi:MAG: hypothetical protein ACREQL_16415 [Candidatus Binatia bacterium]
MMLRLATLLAVLWMPATAPAAMTRACSDPCLQAARGDFRACVSSASGVFLDEVDGCLERDHTCVDACREQRQGCRDSTGVGAGIATCAAEEAVAKQRCRDQFPIGSKRRARCIDQAQVDGNRCRRDVRRSLRSDLRACGDAFDQCASACGAGQPPGGSNSCRAQAKDAVKTELASCKQTFRVTASACIGKDDTCVQGCGDARETCSAPTRAALNAAIQACLAQAAAAIAACQATYPNGGSDFDQCVTTAQANAYTCRQAALDASGPGFAACGGVYLGCVRACPAA